MKLKSILAIVLTYLLLAAPATARELDAVIDHENIAVATNSGNSPKLEQIKQAIIIAANTKLWSANSKSKCNCQ